MSKTPLDILKKHWDYHSFRPKQEAIIDSVLKNKDTFVLLPTGGGKSICYQIPSLLRDGLTLVISPLIALMKDQVHQLKQKGIGAVALDSSLNYNDINRELDNCLYGNYKFLYLSPERLQSEIILERLQYLNINCIAVDEAHCISQWGNDFRPAYANIYKIRQILPEVPVIAVTGSAKPKVIEDIITNLQLKEPQVFKSSFKRENLAYMVFQTENKHQKIIQILKKNPQPSIIYVNNRNKTLQISRLLNEKKFSATYYHGGLDNKEKNKNFMLWMKNDVQVMVATNAFGMGIDKPDVKTVIHLNIPENLENYYQEVGRAGRNDNKAYGVLLYQNSDIDQVKQRVLLALPSADEVKFIYRKLCSFLGIAYQEGELETYDFNINKFSLRYKININKILNALTFLDRQDILRYKKEYHSKTSLQFIVDNFNLIEFIKNNKQYNALINLILRKHGGGFERVITVDLEYLATHLQLKKEAIKTQLLALEKQEIIKLQLFDSDMSIMLLAPREDDRTINRVAKFLIQQNKLKKEQVTAISNFVTDTTTCKEQLILNYFGETSTTNCGICSYCMADKINKVEKNITIPLQIIEILKRKSSTSHELAQQLNCNEITLLNTLKVLLDSDEITVKFNRYSIV